MTELLTLDTNTIDGVLVVRCHGKLVAGVHDILYDEVSRLIPGNTRIILDLSDLAHMDSTGLGALVRLWISARSAHCDLELMNLGKRIRQLLGLTNLLGVFTVIGENNIKTF
jgi:anti-sigma B factor antagonist